MIKKIKEAAPRAGKEGAGMTLKDIARTAGVSVSTVSRILNNKYTKAASQKTRERVWAIIRETNYVPNANAQGLRRSSRFVKANANERRYLACIYARSRDNKDMFFSELARSIEFEAYKNNYILKYSFYADDLEEDSFISALDASDISGIVVLGRFDKERMNAIADAQKNVVYVGLNFTGSRHDAVFCDGFKAGGKAMETLFELGHRRIAYIGELSRENRYRSYCEELARQKIELDRTLVVNVKQTLDGGYRGSMELLQRGSRFSAVFCANDATAMGAIKALQEHGRRVPKDVSVISIDDIEMARYFTPMLTTVHIPINELGRQAAKTLIDRIENGHVLPMKTELPFSLSTRDSCAEAPLA